MDNRVLLLRRTVQLFSSPLDIHEPYLVPIVTSEYQFIPIYRNRRLPI